MDGLGRMVGKSSVVRLLALAFCLLTAACGAAQPGRQAVAALRIVGSTSAEPALRDLAQAFQAGRPDVLVELRLGGSAIGVGELQAGRADLAAVSWKTEAEKAPSGFQAIPIGHDAIAIVVHPANRVAGLTLLQVRALYRGETLEWRALGGAAEEPLIVSREDGSGTRSAFESLVMAADRVTFNAVVMPNSRAVVDYVASHRPAIGYVSMAALTDQVRALPVEETAPSAANVRSGRYHLARVLYLYAPAPTPPATQAFLDFALSPTGQALVAKYHAALR